MFTKQQIDEMERTLQSLDNYSQKAVDDSVSVSHYESPGSPARKSMSVTVKHGAGRQAKDAAVEKAHQIAREHGHDPKSALVSSGGMGDSHSTTCSYSG